MNILDESIVIPVPVIVGGLAMCAGGYAGFQLFEKISHVAEYVLNKQFGDKAVKTSEGDILVTMRPFVEYYKTRLLVQFSLVTLISAVAMQLLVISGAPTFIGVAFMIGSVVTSGVFAFILSHPDIIKERWVKITNEEAIEKGIDVSKLENSSRGWVYSSFGSAPELQY